MFLDFKKFRCSQFYHDLIFLFASSTEFLIFFLTVQYSFPVASFL